MKDIDKINDELYDAIYVHKNQEKLNEIWDSIKNDQESLIEGIEIVSDKFQKKDKVRSKMIAQMILLNYSDVDKAAYNELIKEIYSNKFIARTLVHYHNEPKYSFLLMSLFNKNLKLNYEQKDFVVEEAMSVQVIRRELDYYKTKAESGNIKGKYEFVYLHEKMKYLLDKCGLHGHNSYDLRYYIFLNQNWNYDEKRRLANLLYINDLEFKENLEAWENNIVSEVSTEPGEYNRNCIYGWDMDLLKLYLDEDMAIKVNDEIEFCKLMRELKGEEFDKILKKSLVK